MRDFLRKPAACWLIVATVVVVWCLVWYLDEQRVSPGEKWMICNKNLFQLWSDLGDYATEKGLTTEQVYSEAGKIIRKPDFIQKGNKAHADLKPHYGSSWRFSRNGITPTCPCSPREEGFSYDGRLEAPVNITTPYPVLWDKGPYHDVKGKLKRNVFFSNAECRSMEEAEFNSLTEPDRAKKGEPTVKP